MWQSFGVCTSLQGTGQHSLIVLQHHISVLVLEADFVDLVLGECGFIVNRPQRGVGGLIGQVNRLGHIKLGAIHQITKLHPCLITDGQFMNDNRVGVDV